MLSVIGGFIVCSRCTNTSDIVFVLLPAKQQQVTVKPIMETSKYYNSDSVSVADVKK